MPLMNTNLRLYSFSVVRYDYYICPKCSTSAITQDDSLHFPLSNTLDSSSFITVLRCFLTEQLLCCSYSTPKIAGMIIPQHWTLHLFFLTGAKFSAKHPAFLTNHPGLLSSPSVKTLQQPDIRTVQLLIFPLAWRPMFFHSGRYPIWQGDDHPHPRQVCLLSNVTSWEKVIK